MAAFRRCVIALAVLAIFAGLVSAQTNTAMQCQYNTFPNTIRVEGGTEQVGDITVVCTGGTGLTDGVAVPQVNFVVQLTQNITSRILNTGGVSDALLLIDEPGTGGGPNAGFGSNQAITVCATPVSGCSGFFKWNGSSGSPVLSSSNTGAVATAANTFQGIVSGSSVTFFGIPILAPASAGQSRVFRITNLRVSPKDSGSTSGSGVGSSVTFQGNNVSSLLSLPGNSATVSIVQPGLDPVNTKVLKSAAAASLPVCTGQTTAYVNTLQFQENFGVAFKTRIQPKSGTNDSVSSNTSLQNVPGTYSSESGLTATGLNGSTITTGGLADFGTRLKATFSGIPANVRIFVSATNVAPSNAVAPGAPVAGAAVGTNVPTSFAQLISTSSTETTADAATGPTLATASTAGWVELPVSSGGATAIWEVFNVNNTSTDVFDFLVAITYVANGPPVVGVSSAPTVNLSYAPTASTATTFPHFAASSINPAVFTLNTCRTILMFPYVTSGGGYDTGIALSNTSVDTGVFTTGAQAGACTLNFYPTQNLTPPQGGTTAVGTAVTAFVTPTIVGGTTYANLASIMAPGFAGYIIAACNFQFGHGFAYISDFASPTVSSAMGYLALAVPDVGAAGSRTTSLVNNLETLTH